MSNKNSDYYFLEGGGEMGELIRAKDWSKTSLGDPAGWPQSLRTMVGVMLDNPFGMYIAWGNDYTQLYNDAYRPILGATKHPQALGISTKETFSEIWGNIIGSMFDDVMKGKAVGFPDLMLPLNRNGFVEECYFDFAYSPIRKDNGEVGGVLVTVIETTEKKKAQTKLVENTTQLQFAMDAAELGTWDYDPATNKFTANNRLKTWFGLAESEQIELHHATDAIAEKDRERIIMAITKALDYSSGGNYEEEFSIINPINNNTIIVQGKGRAWFNEDRIAYRFTGVLQEVTEKVLSRKSIEESEARFRAIADDAPVFIFLAGENAEVEYLNKTWRDYTGFTDDFKGRAWAQITHPDDVDPATKIYMDGFNKRESCSFENRQKGMDGIYRTILWKATPRFSINGQFIGMMGVGLDIHERKKSEEKLRESEQKVRALVENAPFPIAVYVGKEMIVELANQSIIDIWGKGNDVIGKSFKEVLPELDNQLVFEQIQKVFETGESFHTQNTPLDLVMDGKLQTFYFNYSFTPLYDIRGNIYGVMNTGVDLTELNIAKKKIEESDKRFRNTMKQAPVGITILRGPQYIVEMANEAYLQLVDKKEAEFVGKPLFSSLPEVEETVHVLLDDVLNTGIPYHGNELPVPLNRYGKLDVFYFDFIYYPLREEDGAISGVIAVATEVTEKVVTRKKIEESKDVIRESKERLEFVLESAKGGDWDMDLLTGKAITSLRHDQCFGATEPFVDWSYEKFLAHVHPEDRESEDRKFKEAASTGGDWSIDCRVVWNDGSIHWIQSSGRNYRFIDGKPTRMLGMVRDVTEQKEAHKQIEESEDTLNIVIEASELGTYELNLKTREPKYSKRYLEILGGYKEDITLTHEQLLQHLHPDDFPIREKAFKDAIDTGYLHYEARLIWKDKSIHWMEGRGKVFYDDKHNPEKLIGTIRDITEEKKHEQELKESEYKFRLLADSMPQHIWTSDPEGNLNYYNQSVFDYSGLTLEQINKDGWIQIVHPEDREENIRQWINAVTTGEDFLFEHRFRRHDGEYRWQLSRAIPQRDENGKIQMWVGTSTDFQEQKDFAKELAKQVELRTFELENKTMQLEEAQQLAHLGSWEWDVVANKIEWSDELFRIFGLRPQEFKADYDNYLKYIHPDDREYVNSIVQKAFKDHQPYSFFHKVAGVDGKVRILSATGKVITDGIGNVIRMSGTAQDVTEQKNYEEELKISEERFYKIFDNNPVAMYLSEIKTNKIKYANSRFYKAFGFTEKDVIGRSAEELNLMDAEETKRVANLLLGYLLEDRSVAEIKTLSAEEREALLLKLKRSEKMKDFEILYTRKNGEKFPALLSFEVIRIGVDSYTVASCQDITERKKAEALLRSQNDQLEKMNKELESFAYISSHDLQEPLRKIQTFATRIIEKEENNLSDSGKYMFNRMQDAAKRMQTLIQDLLAYSRTNTTDQKFERTDLKKIISEVKEDLKEELKEKDATIEANQLCEADIIPFQFRQLMHNLIGNSLKFSNPNHPPVIKIKCEIMNGAKFKNEKLSSHKKYCYISVSDNGIGFEQQYNEKIFEVFQRLHSKNDYNGTGIGLSIVKKIVENHHGIITAKGELNKGATFEIYIPAT